MPAPDTSPRPLRAATQSRLSAGAAIVRGWWILAVLGVIGLGAGVLVAEGRAPVYEARAQVLVSPPSTSINATSAFSSAAAALAVSYSALVTSEPTLRTISTQVGVPVQDLRDRLGAGPAESNALIAITYESSSASQATRVAAAAAKLLVDSVRESLSSDDAASRLLERYQAASAALIAAEADLKRARASGTTGDVRSASSDVQTRQLEVSVAGQLYTSNRQGNTAEAKIELVDNARIIGDDRTDARLKIGFAGALLGLVAGALIAVAAIRRRPRWNPSS